MTKEEVFKAFRESNEPSFTVFLSKLEEEGVVIEAAEVFEEKKRQDEWWKKALERVNNIDEPSEE